jgi:hypothetical protein
MKRFISKYFSISNPSVLFLSLPYLVNNFAGLYTSQFYSSYKYAVLILILITSQLIVSHLYQKNKIFNKYIICGFFSAIFIIIYGADFVNISNQLQEIIFQKQVLRGRVSLLFSTITILVIQFVLFFNTKSGIRFQNLLFAFLSLTVTFSGFTNFLRNDIRTLENRPVKIDSVKDFDKTVYLIITDMYASPIELSRILQDSTVNDFSYELKKKGWFVKDSFYSNETATILSLGSIFNYNLSKDSTFAKFTNDQLIEQCFKKSILAEDLQSKGVHITNNGIFHFGQTEPLTRVCSYPQGFLERLLSNTVLPLIYSNTGGMRFSGFGIEFSSYTDHNIRVFSDLNLPRGLKKAFIYNHLLMPHPPLSFKKEFEAREETTKNYTEFWKFTNRKIATILDELILNKGCKVILIGDHGYRSDSFLNPNLTFAALYGFDSISVEKIHSVQDVGSLINAQFQN